MLKWFPSIVEDFVTFLKEKKRQLGANIYCLQDTHWTEADKHIIRTQWGYECFVAGNRTDARGVAILFNNNFEYKVLRQRLDINGNYIILNIEIENKLPVTLVTIYGPNQDDPEFYSSIQEQLVDMDTEHTIMCADWNLVQDFDLDCCNYKYHNNPRASKAVNDMKQRINMVDPWRVYNPQVRRYTWLRRNPIKKARLDFFLISEELMTFVEKASILPSYKSDHAIIQLELRLTNFTKGKGFWKFNNSLLRDVQYVKKVKNCINQLVDEYAVLTTL